MKNDINNYIKDFPDDVKKRLQKVKQAIQLVLGKADESISYGIPTFKLNGKPIIYFAGFKNHVSVYPASDEMVKFVKGLGKFRVSKGTLLFLHTKPLPLGLIKKAAKFNLKRYLERAKKK